MFSPLCRSLLFWSCPWKTFLHLFISLRVSLSLSNTWRMLIGGTATHGSLRRSRSLSLSENALAPTTVKLNTSDLLFLVLVLLCYEIRVFGNSGLLCLVAEKAEFKRSSYFRTFHFFMKIGVFSWRKTIWCWQKWKFFIRTFITIIVLHFFEILLGGQDYWWNGLLLLF